MIAKKRRICQAFILRHERRRIFNDLRQTPPEPETQMPEKGQ
jgi:hypothetical protein